MGEARLHNSEMLIYCSYDLPDDVFEAGEVKPAKKKKVKVAKPSAEPSSKKRTVDEAKLDVRIIVGAKRRKKAPYPLLRCLKRHD